MKKGQIYLYYNYELDELFLIKRGVLFGKWLLETFEGTSLFETFDELKASTNLLNNSAHISEV